MRPYTLHEAADRMNMKPRTLAKAARKLGACSIFGRDLYFSDADLQIIWEAHRAQLRQAFTSPAIDRAFARLRRLTARIPRNRVGS